MNRDERRKVVSVRRMHHKAVLGARRAAKAEKHAMEASRRAHDATVETVWWLKDRGWDRRTIALQLSIRELDAESILGGSRMPR